MAEHSSDRDRVESSAGDSDIHRDRAPVDRRQAEEPEISEVSVGGNSMPNESRVTGDGLLGPKHKMEATVAEAERSGSSSSFSQKSELSRPSARPWRTLILRLGPLSGIACMLIAALSILVSLGILIGSHNAPTKSSYLFQQIAPT